MKLINILEKAYKICEQNGIKTDHINFEQQYKDRKIDRISFTVFHKDTNFSATVYEFQKGSSLKLLFMDLAKKCVMQQEKKDIGTQIEL